MHDTKPDDRPESDVGRTLIESAIASAERELARTAGDRTLCAIGRSGRPFPAVKYQEGAVATLTGLRARLPRGMTTTTEAIAAARSELDRLDRLGSRSPDWEAYQAGGRDALDRIEHATLPER